MPLYEVQHSVLLDKPQRDELAQTITRIHTRKFVTPSLFVNVRFTDVSGEHNYIAGTEASNEVPVSLYHNGILTAFCCY